MDNYYESYGKAELGDKRLSKRLARSLGQLAGNPEGSIPTACQDPYQAKAIYRLVGNDEVSVEAITKITHKVTVERINEAKPPVILVPQDTSELNYSNLKETEGLGNIGRKKTALGIVVHTAVAISEEGEIYGLLAQKLWTRPPEEFGKSDATRKKLPIEEKESNKWLETLENACAAFPEGTMTVHICDREGDIFEFFCKAERENALYLCRNAHNRNVVEENGTKKLDKFLGALPESGRVSVQVPRDSHTKRKARNAEVVIKCGKCKITKPSNLESSKELPQSVEIYVVSAEEIGVPEGSEKILWQLVTNVPTESFEDAVSRIQWYTQRWKIEIFHRTLKDGCKVEELQSESAEKLKKLLAIYSIIALQIMLLSYIARTRSEESCEVILSEEEWKILYRVAKKTKQLPEKAPTVYEAVVMIAKLGGFPGRKSDGFPGVTVMWRGLTSFHTILDAMPYLS